MLRPFRCCCACTTPDVDGDSAIFDARVHVQSARNMFEEQQGPVSSRTSSNGALKRKVKGWLSIQSSGSGTRRTNENSSRKGFSAPELKDAGALLTSTALRRSATDVLDISGVLPAAANGSFSSNLDNTSPNQSLTDFDQVIKGALLGSGSFGKVYKGKWRSRTVALKVIDGPASAERAREWLKIEVELAMTLKHPNIVCCYCVRTPVLQPPSPQPFRPGDPLTQFPGRSMYSSQGSCHASRNSSFTVQRATRSLSLQRVSGGWSVHDSHAAGLLAVDSSATLQAPVAGDDTQLVMEFCNQGSLADASVSKRFFTMNGVAPNMHAILMRARDIAAGMRYLHSCGVCHGDLKCENVLLQSDPTDPYGCLAKVADFGLSGILYDGGTHVSARHNCGTISHTAPEVLTEGRLCPGSDVFAYGIILWEMVTAQLPFAGLRHGQLILKVVAGERPVFPDHIPAPYKKLATDCWVPDPKLRPTFDVVLSRLRELLKQAAELQRQCEAPLQELHAWLMIC